MIFLILEKLINNGIIIVAFHYISSLLNIIYSFLVFRKRNVLIHCSSKIIGKRFIEFENYFTAGRMFWLEAIGRYNGHVYSPKILIKNNVNINDFVHIAATNYIEIGNNVLIASRVYISDHNHGYYEGENRQSSPLEPPDHRVVSNDQNVIIGDNVWLGEGVCILPGVTIGEGSIIGANAVVSKDIPPNSIAVGIPAKVIKKYDFQKKIWMKIKDF